MLKVLKRYTIPLRRTSATDSSFTPIFILFLIFRVFILFLGNLVPGIDTIFSSYPGTLHSVG
jgi:type II secretory pathway component PulF